MKSVTDMKGGVGAQSSTLRQCQGIGFIKGSIGDFNYILPQASVPFLVAFISIDTPPLL